MTTFRADLHCHSICSDGSLSPTEIIQKAVEASLQGLSITDHDSVNAYETALPAAKQAGIELISGVEFSSMHEGVSVHVLGYSFLHTNPKIIDFCKGHQQRRQERNRGILELLTENNMPITEEEIVAVSPIKHSTIGRPHIALAMMKKGYIENVTDAFLHHIGEGKPCYVRGNLFSVQETIDTIHEANGFAIIAHPHLIKESNVLHDILEMNFDGLEGYYARFNPSQNERWISIANKKGWLITGGSDFHGDIKPAISLGCAWAPEETFRVLRDRFEENNK